MGGSSWWTGRRKTGFPSGAGSKGRPWRRPERRPAMDVDLADAPDGAPTVLPDADMLRLLIVSDAWTPQVNGVVRTLSTAAARLRALGDEVEVIGPARFRTLPMPGYPEIRLALRPART